MKILIVSDSHHNSDKLDEIVKKHPRVDTYLHLGDSEDYDLAIIPFESVKGNCDYFDYPTKRIIRLMNFTIIATHKLASFDEITKNNANVILFGHTHVPKVELDNHRLFLNPGSLSYPRSSLGCTYMILEITEEAISVSLYSTDNFNVIKTTTFKLNELM